MPDGDDTVDATDTASTTETAQTGSSEPNADFYKAEARKAFAARDKLKAELRELQSGGLSQQEVEEYRALKEAQEVAEQERLKEKGEYEKALEKATRKYTEEMAAKDQAVSAAEQKLRSTLIGLSFAQASDWFGDKGRTVLIPEIAETYFGKYVDLQDDVVVVKDLDGDVIMDPQTGKPAPFSQAIGELIESMPQKNKILRGSGKAGSGSSGGADEGHQPANRRQLAELAMKGDKEAVEALKRSPAGRRTRSIWDRAAAG